MHHEGLKSPQYTLKSGTFKLESKRARHADFPSSVQLAFMTGINDIFRAPPRFAVHATAAIFHLLLPLLPSPLAWIVAPLGRFITSFRDRRRCPQPALPDLRATLALMHGSDVRATPAPAAAPELPGGPMRWAVLLPIT
jgi:hypothetical protein